MSEGDLLAILKQTLKQPANIGESDYARHVAFIQDLATMLVQSLAHFFIWAADKNTGSS